MKHVYAKTVTGVAVAVGALSAAGAAAAPRAHLATSGRIDVISVSHPGAKAYDLVTGAITDHGTDRSQGRDKEKITLSKGTFVVDSKQFNKSFTFKVNPASCAVVGTSHAAGARISDGTGAYAGISGTITLKAVFTEIAKRTGGKCQVKANPLAGVGVITGTGTVSY